MQVALGRSASDEIRPGIFKASKVCVPFFLTVVVLYYLVFYFLLFLHMLWNVFFSWFMVMLDFLLRICQRKRSKGIIFLSEALIREKQVEGLTLYPSLLVIFVAYLTLTRILTFQGLVALQ